MKSIKINSVSELHNLLGLEKPHHPLITIINFENIVSIKKSDDNNKIRLINNLYSITLKKNLKGKIKYGQGSYDFDEGVLGMMSPGQVISGTRGGTEKYDGWWLLFHPDFIQSYALTKTIKSYGYFSYSVNEALLLSGKEQLILENIFANISEEYRTSIDDYSQDLMVSQLELLLNYINRYYGRQFLTRKTSSKSIIERFETAVAEYFVDENLNKNELPSVYFFSEQLNISPHYLTDLLKKWTGKSAQQHIHEILIEKAKEILVTTDSTASEIAYTFGFVHPQAFYKLFKAKTGMTPLSFRKRFN